MEHSFTAIIKEVLLGHFNKNAVIVFEKSELLQYLNNKTRSAERGSKSRSSFATLYALYVVIEDYIVQDFHQRGDYSKYEGAIFNRIFARQRELPFGNKLQNHALNNRTNAEFQKFFPQSAYIPILRNLETNRYWINENLLKITVGKRDVNIAKAVVEIINRYSETKKVALTRFIQSCEQIRELEHSEREKAEAFILGLLAPNVDARLFEIVSFGILKYFYHDQIVIWGFSMDKLVKEHLQLFKTGRTNANDGGIDFVMKPLGRFFQVTETLNFRKYFLDIDKIQKYPVTFVIKTNEPIPNLEKKIREDAAKTYPVEEIVNKYMGCIEEIVNIPELEARCKKAIQDGYLDAILDEIIRQSKVEFNYTNSNDE